MHKYSEIYGYRYHGLLAARKGYQIFYYLSRGSGFYLYPRIEYILGVGKLQLRVSAVSEYLHENLLEVGVDILKAVEEARLYIRGELLYQLFKLPLRSLDIRQLLRLEFIAPRYLDIFVYRREIYHA